MCIALIGDSYYPLRNSCAVQLRDLAREFQQQGHKVVVIVPTVNLNKHWTLERLDEVQVLRLAAFPTRDFGYFRRTLSEMILPFAMLFNLRKSPFRKTIWDAIVWYSPTIFFGPLLWVLKRNSNCRTFLILRDIFPEWTLDIGFIRKGPVYYFFKLVAHFQYAMADTIGVQTPSNLVYLANWAKQPGRRLEVLYNWLAQAPDLGSTIKIADTRMLGKIIFVYIGNMGVAQGMDIFIDLADSLKNREDIGFLFVGRGTEVPRLRANTEKRELCNILFYDEVDTSEIPSLLAQCHVGLLGLDTRHRTHNIPGKFLTYMQSGLPVLARVNPGTDLAHLIEKEGVGRVYTGESVEIMRHLAEKLADNSIEREKMSLRGRCLSDRMFSPKKAASQIVANLCL